MPRRHKSEILKNENLKGKYPVEILLLVVEGQQSRARNFL